MEKLNSFESPDESLHDLLKDVSAGRIQLPDFQREWKWDDDHIRSLLASVSLSYPIGAIMTLEVGDGAQRFQPRLVAGVNLASAPRPEQLLLDGQQRVTSLYQVLSSGQPVETKDARNKPIKRWYYLDIAKALDPNADREEAIVSVPHDRIRRDFRGQPLDDLSAPKLEQIAEMMPFSLIFDPGARNAWMMGYVQIDPGLMQARLERWGELQNKVLARFDQYKLPVIRLLKKTPKEAVCHVFEKVNTGGVPLNVFELLSAMFAMNDFRLRDDWEDRRIRFARNPILRDVESTDFLMAIALLATRAKREQARTSGAREDELPGIGCKRKDVLELTLESYRRWADAVTQGFERAARLLRAEGIFTARDLPYRTQLTPLAAIHAVLGTEAELEGVRRHLARWYWCGVLGELYGSAVESRFARDVAEVPRFIEGGGAEPSSMTDAFFRPERLLTLRSRNSAAYKGIHALILRSHALDFRTGEAIDVQRYFDEAIDIHHVFPQKFCRDSRIAQARCDSIVNKTALSAKTNRLIGGKAPSRYLGILQRSAGISEERMDVILASHLIDVDAIRNDDFDRFFEARKAHLLGLIENAMGKAVSSTVQPEVEAEEEEWEDEPDVEADEVLISDGDQQDAIGKMQQVINEIAALKSSDRSEAAKKAWQTRRAEDR